MNGTMKYLDKIEIELRNRKTDEMQTVFIDVFDNSLSRKWLKSVDNILRRELHLEKNYHFFGFAHGPRDGNYILTKLNETVSAINRSDLNYFIPEYYTLDNTIHMRYGLASETSPCMKINHAKMNMLHRYFEDLQGTSGNMSSYYEQADNEIKWHIRQLNLLCHEFESWALSNRKETYNKDWVRMSELFCFLKAPRFHLTEEDYENFGIETLARKFGGVYVGVNKAIGKHHWEVFKDEDGRSIDELTTGALRSQTEAAGDFDIEWGRDPGEFPWMQKELQEFREWLIKNGFDPNDKSLTIGHPRVGQVNLYESFGTVDHRIIWKILYDHMDVYSIRTSNQYAEFPYNWDDVDYKEQQIKALL